MPRRIAPLLPVLTLLAAAPRSAGAVVTVPTDFVDREVVAGLSQPRAFAFLPDGRALFIEQRTAQVRMVVGSRISTIDPILVVPSVNSNGYERGMQGIAVDPKWPARPYVYLYHNRVGGFNRLVRYTASGRLNAPANDTLFLSDPRVLIDDVPDTDPNHNAGCLKFSPDNFLYLSLGEDEVPCTAQDSTSLRGQIVRLDVTRVGPEAGGQVPRALLIPPGNPLSTADSNAALVWAYGMRNPWVFGVDPETGTIYAADVGEANYEEINEVRPGGNYGWPYREGPLVMPRTSCPEPGGDGNPANGYRPAIVTYARPSGLTAIFSAGMYRAATGGTLNWPFEYRGDVFWGEYYTGFMRRVKRAGNGIWSPAPPVPGQPNASDWGTGFLNATDFNVGPDGSLWWLQQFDDDQFNDFTGSLRRVTYTGPPVGAPHGGGSSVSLAASPSPFVARTELSFVLTSPAHVRLTVYDLSGRRVRTLLDRDAPAGAARASWAGDDDRGGPVAPGVYLARLERSGSAETLRLLRLR